MAFHYVFKDHRIFPAKKIRIEESDIGLLLYIIVEQSKFILLKYNLVNYK